MFGIGIGIGIGRQRFGDGFDADYQAVLNYATTQGFTLPSASQQELQNQLLVDLKAAGVWSKLDTFGVFATDGNSDFALIDWKRLSQYTAINSPTFSSNGGFTGNGTSSYVDTNFNPSIGTNQFTLNNASRIFWVDNRGVGATAFDGTTGTSQNSSRNGSTGTITLNSGNTAATGIVNFNVDGWHSIHRVSSLSLNVYLGSNATPQIAALNSTGIFNSNQFILRLGTNYGNHRLRIYGMGSDFSSVQNTAFFNAINTYLTSI